MAKLAKLPGMAIVDGLKGKIDFYVWMGIVCARKWPKSPGHDRAPAVEAQWPAFTYANTSWQDLQKEIKDAWNQMASTIPFTGKDMFVKSYISNYHIEITLEGE